MSTPQPANTESSGPRVCVVIPTRNRSKTLKYCLETITAQRYPHLAIVVSDNCSSDDTETVVKAAADPRIKYVRSDRPLTINESYSFALSHAVGDFVTFIGDDDGFLPDAIAFAMSLLADTRYSALTWRKLEYHWPDHRDASVSNVVHGRSEPVVLAVNGARKLRLFAEFREAYNNLPCLYNSFVSMKTIETVRQHSPDGVFFGGVIPDVHSGIVLSPFIGSYLQAMFPLTVNGASSMSGGVLHGAARRSEQEEKLIADTSPSALKKSYGADIGESPSIVSIAFGEFLIARSRVRGVDWPEPRWRRYVHALIREAQGSPHRDAIFAAARHTARQRGLAVRIPAPTAALPVWNRGTDLNSFQGRIVLPADLISDVHQAARLFGSLLPQTARVESRPAMYFARRWMQQSFRSAIEIYRAWRSASKA